MTKTGIILYRISKSKGVCTMMKIPQRIVFMRIPHDYLHNSEESVKYTHERYFNGTPFLDHSSIHCNLLIYPDSSNNLCVHAVFSYPCDCDCFRAY